MLRFQLAKCGALLGMTGEVVAWLQSQPVLGLISFVGTAVSAASAWYWSDKAHKRKDRREEHLERTFEVLLKTFAERVDSEVKAGRPDPFPDITKLLLEAGTRDEQP